MNKKILLLMMMLLLPMLAIVFMYSSCSSDNNLKEEDVDETEIMAVFFAKLQSAPYADASEEDTFPEWLLDKINEIETQNNKDVNIIKVHIFYGEWNNQFFYYISNPFYSCGLCEVYYENGKKVVWSEIKDPDDPENFCNTSKNWKIVYEFGNGDLVGYRFF